MNSNRHAVIPDLSGQFAPLLRTAHHAHHAAVVARFPRGPALSPGCAPRARSPARSDWKFAFPCPQWAVAETEVSRAETHFHRRNTRWRSGGGSEWTWDEARLGCLLQRTVELCSHTRLVFPAGLRASLRSPLRSWRAGCRRAAWVCGNSGAASARTVRTKLFFCILWSLFWGCSLTKAT